MLRYICGDWIIALPPLILYVMYATQIVDSIQTIVNSVFLWSAFSCIAF